MDVWKIESKLSDILNITTKGLGHQTLGNIIVSHSAHCSKQHHELTIYLAFDKQLVITDVVKCVQDVQLDEFLGSKRGVSLPYGTPQEWFVVLDRVGLQN